MFGCKAQKIEILVERAVGERANEQTKHNKYTQKNEKKKYGKETGKFARLNECNNKITLSQISFLFVVVGYFD